jgi:hypothetical protein
VAVLTRQQVSSFPDRLSPGKIPRLKGSPAIHFATADLKEDSGIDRMHGIHRKQNGSVGRNAPQLAAWLLLFLTAPIAHAEGLVDTLVRRFAQSDFEFLRAQSNAPFLPLAWLNVTGYQEGQFTPTNSDVTNATFQQRTVSQGVFLPLPIGKSNAVVIGEWVDWTDFDLRDARIPDLEVWSVSIPIGWINQSAPSWQLAAFVAPLAHKSNREADWYWETLGGVFARHTTNDRTAWVFGAYFDVSPLEDFYTPYLGATFILNEHWSLNAVMPWPAVVYAPSTDTFFRLGVAPSGSSWSAEGDAKRPRIALSAWNFGLGVERHLFSGFWLGFEVGVSGLRGLSLVGNDWQDADTRLGNTGYAFLTFNFRPSQVLALEK